jgi:septation ring formation regulator EzrA
MSKITLVVRSTEEIHEEIAKKREALHNVRADLAEARKRLDRIKRDFHEAQRDVDTFQDLKDSFAVRIGQLQFQLGQNDIYEQMLAQGIIAEPVKP